MMIEEKSQNQPSEEMKDIQPKADFESDKKKLTEEEIVKHNQELIQLQKNAENGNKPEPIMDGNRSGLARYNHFLENRGGGTGKYFGSK